MTELLDYKCPACGGRLEFDTKEQKLKCPFCDSVYDVSEFEARDEAALNENDVPADAIDWDTSGIESFTEEEAGSLSVFVCEHCGGEIVTDPTTASTACPFCDSPVVVPKKLEGDLRPDLVIPFRLDKKAAMEAFRRHLSGKKLLPRVFKTQNHLESIKGVYVPFWLFDASVDADITYRATKVKKWKEGEFDCADTGFFDVFREGSVSFENVPVSGSTKVSGELMESLEPYDIKEAQPFRSAFLAGYLADRYDIDLQSAKPRADVRIKRSTEDAFLSTVKGYETVKASSSKLNVSGARTRYVLYPVWLLNTTWQGGRYVFAMNGQTGKFVGDLPEDKAIARRWFWGLGAGITAAAFLIYSIGQYLV